MEIDMSDKEAETQLLELGLSQDWGWQKFQMP